VTGASNCREEVLLRAVNYHGSGMKNFCNAAQKVLLCAWEVVIQEVMQIESKLPRRAIFWP
jgi:hypothetical protein